MAQKSRRPSKWPAARRRHREDDAAAQYLGEIPEIGGHIAAGHIQEVQPPRTVRAGQDARPD